MVPDLVKSLAHLQRHKDTFISSHTTCTHACMHTHLHTCTCTHMHTRTHMHACMHAHTHAHTCSHLHTHTCTCSHTHIRICTHMHAPMHTHTHTRTTNTCITGNGLVDSEETKQQIRMQKRRDGFPVLT